MLILEAMMYAQLKFKLVTCKYYGFVMSMFSNTCCLDVLQECVLWWWYIKTKSSCLTSCPGKLPYLLPLHKSSQLVVCLCVSEKTSEYVHWISMQWSNWKSWYSLYCLIAHFLGAIPSLEVIAWSSRIWTLAIKDMSLAIIVICLAVLVIWSH